MTRLQPDRTAADSFLKMAGFWFDNAFEYKNVAKWCRLSEKQGRLILDQLIQQGRVKVKPDGTTVLATRARPRLRQAA